MLKAEISNSAQAKRSLRVARNEVTERLVVMMASRRMKALS